MAKQIIVATPFRQSKVSRSIVSAERTASPHSLPATNEKATNHAIPFVNVSGETIPARGVMQCTGSRIVNQNLLLEMDKPGGEYPRLCFVNGSREVEDEKQGGCYTLTSDREFPRLVLYDKSSAPAYGEQWGPQPDSWMLKRGNLGFQVLGENTNANLLDSTSAGLLYARQREVTAVDCINTASVADSLSTSAAAVLVVGSASVNFTLAVYKDHIDQTGGIVVNSELHAVWLDRWRIVGRGCGTDA